MVKSILFSFMTALKFCQNHSSNTSFSALTTGEGGGSSQLLQAK